MSHLSDIGFPINNVSELGNLILSNRIKSKIKFYKNFIGYKLLDKSGAGIYSFDRTTFWRNLGHAGFCPFFEGEGSQNIEIVEINLNLEPQKEEGNIYIWVRDEQEGEEYPLIVEIANYPALMKVVTGGKMKMNITLFAEYFEYYHSNEELKKKKSEENKETGDFVSSGMFIPTGTFSPTDDPNFKQTPRCWCYGEIVKFSCKENSITGNKFYHFLMKTYAATYDVVVDSEYVKAEPKIGGVIGGNFWVCSYITS